MKCNLTSLTFLLHLQSNFVFPYCAGELSRSRIGAMRNRRKARVQARSAPGLSDQGFIRVKTLLALLLLGVAGLVIYRVAPPYLVNGQLADKIRTEARFAQTHEKTPQQVRAAILREALQLDIPLQADNIHIEMNASGTHITADYSVIVNLYYRQVGWEFHIDSRR